MASIKMFIEKPKLENHTAISNNLHEITIKKLYGNYKVRIFKNYSIN